MRKDLGMRQVSTKVMSEEQNNFIYRMVNRAAGLTVQDWRTKACNTDTTETRKVHVVSCSEDRSDPSVWPL